MDYWRRCLLPEPDLPSSLGVCSPIWNKCSEDKAYFGKCCRPSQCLHPSGPWDLAKAGQSMLHLPKLLLFFFQSISQGQCLREHALEKKKKCCFQKFPELLLFLLKRERGILSWWRLLAEWGQGRQCYLRVEESRVGEEGQEARCPVCHLPWSWG